MINLALVYPGASLGLQYQTFDPRITPSITLRRASAPPTLSIGKNSFSIAVTMPMLVTVANADNAFTIEATQHDILASIILRKVGQIMMLFFLSRASSSIPLKSLWTEHPGRGNSWAWIPARPQPYGLRDVLPVRGRTPSGQYRRTAGKDENRMSRPAGQGSYQLDRRKWLASNDAERDLGRYDLNRVGRRDVIVRLQIPGRAREIPKGHGFRAKCSGV
jgi:hypothetical protein